MRAVPRLLYLFSFIGLAVVAALALNRVVEPSIATTLLRTVIVASLCGAPGLIHRKLWPLSLVLLPAGVYLLLRTIMPVPALVEGAGGQYHFYVEQLRLGADAYLSQVFPLTSVEVPEIEILLSFSAYWLVGAAAFIALSLRQPIPGAVLLLVLLGFSLTVDGAPRVLWSALLFLVLAACLLVLSRSLDRTEWTLRDTLAGGTVGVVASLLALLLLVTVPSAVATPWQDWRAWDPFGGGRSTYTFNWLQNYPRLLDPANDVVIMRVESPSPSYWRANALETFTGRTWTGTQGFRGENLESTPAGKTYVYTVPGIFPTPNGPTVTQTFRVESIYTNYLFVGGDPESVEMDQDLVLRTNRQRAIHSNRALGPSLTYTVSAVVPDLKPTDVKDKGSDYPPSLDLYKVLPFRRIAQLQGDDPEADWQRTLAEDTPELGEWENLYALNEEIVGDATDPYEVILRIEKYLRDSRFFEYSLSPPPSGYTSPYAAFLFETRSGYCQHFAGAMALLLRYNGIPARVAVGFATGEEEQEGSGVYTVSTNNAHAWVESYVPQIGWVAFDPTPSRNLPTPGPSSSSPGFINPFADSDLGGSGALPPQLPRENFPEGPPIVERGSTGAGGSWLARVAWLPWVLAVVILLVTWPVGRSQWRKRRLRRGSREERLQASLALLRREMADCGLAVRPSHTLEDTFSILDSTLHIDPDPLLVGRAEAVLFGGYQAREADFDQTEAFRRTVTQRLRRRQGWVRTWLMWYGVPPLSTFRRQEA